MPLAAQSINAIEATVRDSLRRKFQNYNPESKHMPFHFNLLGKDRMALHSFVQSLNTTFGTSIFEPVAVVLAKTKFYYAETQHAPGDQISDGAQKVIQSIINNLSTGNSDTDKKKLRLLEKFVEKAR